MTTLTYDEPSIAQFENGIRCTGLVHNLLGSVDLRRLKNDLGFRIEAPDIDGFEERMETDKVIDTKKLSLTLHPPEGWKILAVKVADGNDDLQIMSYLMTDTGKRARLRMPFKAFPDEIGPTTLLNRFRIIPVLKADLHHYFEAYIGTRTDFPELSLIDQNVICDETGADGKTPKPHVVIQTFPAGASTLEDAENHLLNVLGRQKARCPFEYWGEDPVPVS